MCALGALDVSQIDQKRRAGSQAPSYKSTNDRICSPAPLPTRPEAMVSPATSNAMVPRRHQSCIEACNVCADACDYCSSSCLQEDDVKMMAACVRLDMDCAEICRMAVAGTRQQIRRGPLWPVCGRMRGMRRGVRAAYAAPLPSLRGGVPPLCREASADGESVCRGIVKPPDDRRPIMCHRESASRSVSITSVTEPERFHAIFT